MVENISREQWAAMTPADVALWVMQVMAAGAESPFPEGQPETVTAMA